MDARYNPFTGRPVVPGLDEPTARAVELGLEPPRFCAHCGRRMVVQIDPDGWWAKCSRHPMIDSASLERR
ncbi:biotin synthase auxiliary protein BsaP [Nocardia jinanensis]|uniref:Biotin synthase auxiliary protein n=1 Tax=Nocardia jinanensis TaxID=382504 RepID=A0A917REQ3_9NOCA|nr:hypothetical protein [Nocardia jinanensis]GGL03849.1 hypothetical protein GCM10011588_18110 [Nocardia jinanensis]